ncbi:DNA helicase, partial [Achromatium sp. WMS2]
RLIFQAITALAADNQPFDVITLSEQLERQGLLKSSGGLNYLVVIAQETPTAANILAYAKIVRNNSILRNLITAGTDMAASAYHPAGRDVNEILDTAERNVFAIADQITHGSGGFQAMKTLTAKALDRIDDLSANADPIIGLATGFSDFDKLTSGVQNGDLIIIAGRPSMGKTAYALGIASNIAIKYERPVAIFSMEMSAESLTIRLMAALGRIEQQHLRTGSLENEEWTL